MMLFQFCRDDFICATCQKEHRYLHIQWTEDGNILEISSSVSEKGCKFLDNFRQGIIYDFTNKKLEEVIRDEFTREIISGNLVRIKKEYKNRQRNKFICKKLGETQYLSNGNKRRGHIRIEADLEKAGIELIKEEIFACDNCGKRFTDEDIQKKNYHLDYSETIYCGILTTTEKKFTIYFIRLAKKLIFNE
jgi:hypothetical protein